MVLFPNGGNQASHSMALGLAGYMCPTGELEGLYSGLTGPLDLGQAVPPRTRQPTIGVGGQSDNVISGH